MNQRAEVCLQNALEYERAAVLVTEPTQQAMYRDLARKWREMAEQSEMLEPWPSASKEQR